MREEERVREEWGKTHAGIRLSVTARCASTWVTLAVQFVAEGYQLDVHIQGRFSNTVPKATFAPVTFFFSIGRTQGNAVRGPQGHSFWV